MELKSVSYGDESRVVRSARRVTWLGFWVNIVLSVFKVFAGVKGKSSAMVADGVHSLSDCVTDVVVLAFVGISRRKANEVYQYGHGKFETFATMLLALVLGVVGALFLVDGIGKISAAVSGEAIPVPAWPALVMAVASILCKEWLYRYTRRVGERINSAVVVANAWHHRSDALSSMATLAGVGGAMFLGENWRVLDPLASVFVSVFILVVAVKIGKPAVMELLEIALPADIVGQMCHTIGHTPGVMAFHHFASRRNGSRMIVDFHIKVNPAITVEQAHVIADDVEQRLKGSFGQDMLVTIHIEPYCGQSVDCNNMCV